MKQLQEISYSKLKSLVHHKRVKTVWTHTLENCVIPQRKEFISDNYYFNKEDGSIITPCFIFSSESKFYAISDSEFTFESQYGKTTLTILWIDPVCSDCQKPYEKAKNRWECHNHGNTLHIMKFRRK